MLRAIVLSLVLLVGLGAVIPLATEYAEAGSKKKRKNKKKRKKVKKYSKQWWRMYRAKQKRKKALAARKRALRLRAERNKWQKKGDGKWIVETTWNGKEWVSRDIWIAEGKSYLGRYAHHEDPQPVVASASKEQRRERQVSPKSEVQFKVKNTGGADLGSASITVVGPAVGESRGVGTYKTLGGVSTSSLRRTVIDQMIRENGWVVNDYQKKVGNQPVYVVVAQSPGAGGGIQSRLFYFTEVDGRIYSVATNSPKESTGQIADEAEKVVNVLRQNGRTVQAGLR